MAEDWTSCVLDDPWSFASSTAAMCRLPEKSQYAADARDDEPVRVEIWIEPYAIQQYRRGWCSLCALRFVLH